MWPWRCHLLVQRLKTLLTSRSCPLRWAIVEECSLFVNIYGHIFIFSPFVVQWLPLLAHNKGCQGSNLVASQGPSLCGVLPLWQEIAAVVVSCVFYSFPLFLVWTFAVYGNSICWTERLMPWYCKLIQGIIGHFGNILQRSTSWWMNGLEATAAGWLISPKGNRIGSAHQVLCGLLKPSHCGFIRGQILASGL